MKNNTENTKALLQKALLGTPQDNALSEVRYHIRAALQKIENVEKKRDIRQAGYERREAARAAAAHQPVNPYDPFKALQAIDEEIAKTKASIDEIRRRRTQPKQEEGDDGDELQNVFG